MENEKNESQMGSVSVRAWIAVLLVITVCCMSAGGLKVEEPLYTLVGMALGWYFGQKEKK
jgi:hypothetical protein